MPFFPYEGGPAPNGGHIRHKGDGLTSDRHGGWGRVEHIDIGEPAIDVCNHLDLSGRPGHGDEPTVKQVNCSSLNLVINQTGSRRSGSCRGLTGFHFQSDRLRQ